MSESQDFAALRASSERCGCSYAIGCGVGRARDQVARGLVRMGATPNRLSFGGLAATLCAAACLVLGAGLRAPWEARAGGGAVGSWWPMAACVCLLVACAFDMLDGAVARIGGMTSPFGGVLDSTLDRFSDLAIYLACAIHFGMAGNLTYNVLAIVAMCNAYLISYVKARAEALMEDCGVGFWLRGERCGAFLVATALGHVPALLWQQAALPLFTVIRRLGYARAALAANSAGVSPPARGPCAGRRRYLAPWRFPRGSLLYDLVAVLNIAFLAAGPWLYPLFSGSSDPFRRGLERLVAG